MANFPRLMVLMVWGKATSVIGVDPQIRRKDVCGAWIDWREYGNLNSDYGWEIDHIVPPMERS